jgi:hypothetical protein
MKLEPITENEMVNIIVVDRMIINLKKGFKYFFIVCSYVFSNIIILM